MKKHLFLLVTILLATIGFAEPIDRTIINSIAIKMKLIQLSRVAPDLPDYYLSATEVTYGEWIYVKTYAENYLNYTFFCEGTIGSLLRQRHFFNEERDRNQPVTNISWYDCVIWCNALSEMSGLTPYYRIDKENLKSVDFWSIFSESTDEITSGVNSEADGYRLPDYREWVYVTLGNQNDASLSKYIFGIESEEEFKLYANYNNNEGRSSSFISSEESIIYDHDGGTLDVASKRSNSFGIYDLVGNVQEWLEYFIVIGGDYSSTYDECMSYRYSNPAAHVSFIGFRVARNGR